MFGTAAEEQRVMVMFACDNAAPDILEAILQMAGQLGHAVILPATEIT